jgi:hypothetical protein
MSHSMALTGTAFFLCFFIQKELSEVNVRCINLITHIYNNILDLCNVLSSIVYQYK